MAVDALAGKMLWGRYVTTGAIAAVYAVVIKIDAIECGDILMAVNTLAGEMG
jgi:hypothetical protein